MSDLPGGEDDLAAIHAAFAKTVRYTGGALSNASVPAVRAHGRGEDFIGQGETLRMVRFELRKANVPAQPVRGDGIVENDGAGQAWSVIDATDRDDVDAWLVTVEEA